MTFQQLRVLAKVIETGNKTKTGELLNITQSGVSHTIKTLENELWIKNPIKGQSRNFVNSEWRTNYRTYKRNLISRGINSSKDKSFCKALK